MKPSETAGKTISIPVWFALDGEKLYLLPVHGSDTQWYKNVRNNPWIRIEARGVGAESHPAPAQATYCSFKTPSLHQLCDMTFRFSGNRRYMSPERAGEKELDAS